MGLIHPEDKNVQELFNALLEGDTNKAEKLATPDNIQLSSLEEFDQEALQASDCPFR